MLYSVAASAEPTCYRFTVTAINNLIRDSTTSDIFISANTGSGRQRARDKANAAKTLILHLGHGADPFFESINLSTLAITSITQSGAVDNEILGAADISRRWLTQATAGAVTLVGTQGAQDYRGLALVHAPVTGIPEPGTFGALGLGRGPG